jgi:hypothetical protein
VPRWQQLLL